MGSCVATWLPAVPLWRQWAGSRLRSWAVSKKKSVQATGNSESAVQAANGIEAGRYLVLTNSNNDCHTEGFMQANGNVAESDWLAASSVGGQRPWDPSYSTNLLLRVQEISEDEWVTLLNARTFLPPMPGLVARCLSNTDKRAIY